MTLSQRTFIIVILSATLAIGGSEIYAPSLPHLVNVFGTTTNMIQWSMTVYMAGLSLTQLIYGPLSDMFGRRSPMMVGLLLFVLGAFLGSTAKSIEGLLIARLIQGIGAGGPTGLWRSIIRDVYHGPQLGKYASYLTLTISAVMPIAPSLGGYLESAFGWESVFLFMGAYGLFALLFLIFFFQETNKSLNPDRLTARYVLRNYWQIASHPIFIGGTFITSIVFGLKFSAILVASIFFIQILGFSPIEFGWIMSTTVITSYMLTGAINSFYVNRVGVDFMLKIGITLPIISGTILGVSYLIVGLKTPFLIASLFFLYCSGALVFPNAFATAFAPLKKNIGYAGAFYGFMQTGGGAVIGGLISMLPDTTPLPFAGTLVFFSGLAFFLHRHFIKNKQPEME
jgi:Bcr/CflA subfamily drug resistance transporter